MDTQKAKGCDGGTVLEIALVLPLLMVTLMGFLDKTFYVMASQMHYKYAIEMSLGEQAKPLKIVTTDDGDVEVQPLAAEYLPVFASKYGNYFANNINKTKTCMLLALYYINIDPDTGLATSYTPACEGSSCDDPAIYAYGENTSACSKSHESTLKSYATSTLSKFANAKDVDSDTKFPVGIVAYNYTQGGVTYKRYTPYLGLVFVLMRSPARSFSKLFASGETVTTHLQFPRKQVGFYGDAANIK